MDNVRGPVEASAPSPQRRDERTPQREGGGSRRDSDGGGAVRDRRPPLPQAAVPSGAADSAGAAAPAVLMETLLRYESMVHLQEKEDAAAEAHLRPLFDRIIELGRGSVPVDAGDDGSGDDDHVPKLTMSGSSDDGCDIDLDKERHSTNSNGNPEAILTFSSLAAALEHIEAAESSSTSAAMDGKKLSRTPEDEVLSSDRQLVLALHTLANEHNEYRRAADTDDLNEEVGSNGATSPRGLTFAEFLHCYRTVIAGMQAMNRMPQSSSSSDGSATAAEKKEGKYSGKMDARARTRQRTLKAVQLFGPGKSASSEDTKRMSVTVDKESSDGKSVCNGGKVVALLAAVVAAIAMAAAHESSLHNNTAIQPAKVDSKSKKPVTNQAELIDFDSSLTDTTAQLSRTPNSLTKPSGRTGRQPRSILLSEFASPNRNMLEKVKNEDTEVERNADDSIGKHNDVAREGYSFLRHRRGQSLSAALGGAALGAFLASVPAVASYSAALSAAAGAAALMNAGGAMKLLAWLKWVVGWARKIKGPRAEAPRRGQT